MGFDYGWTCGAIDKAIEGGEESIENMLKELIKAVINETTYNMEPEDVDKVEDQWNPERVKNMASDWVTSIYGETVDACESVRTENEDMRKDAEYQIGKLEEDKEDLDGQIQDLNREVKDLENQINELEEETKCMN